MQRESSSKIPEIGPTTASGEFPHESDASDITHAHPAIVHPERGERAFREVTTRIVELPEQSPELFGGGVVNLTG